MANSRRNNNYADPWTWGGNAIKSTLGSLFNGYWVTNLADTTLTVALATTESSPWAIGVGILIASITGLCDYKVHTTQDTQNQDNYVSPPIVEEELSNIDLSCKRQAYLKGAFLADALSIAGGFVGLFELGSNYLYKKPLQPVTKLLASFGTFAIGCCAARGEYRTHKKCMQRDQFTDDHQNSAAAYQALNRV